MTNATSIISRMMDREDDLRKEIDVLKDQRDKAMRDVIREEKLRASIETSRDRMTEFFKEICGISFYDKIEEHHFDEIRQRLSKSWAEEPTS